MMKILLIDNVPARLSALEIVLRQALRGVETERAVNIVTQTTTDGARNLFCKESFDVVIVKNHVQRYGDGGDLAYELHQQEIGVRFILYAADAHDFNRFDTQHVCCLEKRMHFENEIIGHLNVMCS